ncbi:MAG: TonB family protein [Woeseiaceae bacterium]|nr:TonB family protein [Woeseiaceae bacterium]
MANITAQLDPLDELRLVATPPPDRLPAMLFLAALIHGVLIIGIAFNPALTSDFTDAISLEVTIVAETDQNIDRPDGAEYLAQTSQEGGGNTAEHVRPSAAVESASPIDNRGVDSGNSFDDAHTHERAADELLASRRDSDTATSNDPRSEPQPQQQIAMALEKGSDTTLPLPQDMQATLEIHDDDPRQLVVSADTEASDVAQYLDTWKRRIEAVGNDYFPEIGGLAGATGSPTLEVSISASGDLAEVVIRKSSGSAVIDQAALDILRRASPFDPFPPHIRAEYDSLRFAYKWLFAEESLTKTASIRRP